MTEVVVIDNYDSFTYNLVDYLGHHVEVQVVPNDTSFEVIAEMEPDGIVISPGPGNPANQRDVGVDPEVLHTLSQRTPTFGVCLGLEIAVHAFGGTVERAPEPVHGRASTIHHDGEGVFSGLPATFRGGRYHSLIATSVPESFKVTAWSEEDGHRLIMGIRHREFPIECVMFHPESVLTPVGRQLMANVATQFINGPVTEVAQG